MHRIVMRGWFLLLAYEELNTLFYLQAYEFGVFKQMNSRFGCPNVQLMFLRKVLSRFCLVCRCNKAVWFTAILCHTTTKASHSNQIGVWLLTQVGQPRKG